MTKRILVLLALCALAHTATTTTAAHIRNGPNEAVGHQARHNWLIEDISIKNLSQRVDHFSALNSKTFGQRYFEHSVNYATGGPIFIIVGGEDFLLYPHMLNNSMALQLAVEERGAAFHLEQRYYGFSLPAELVAKHLCYPIEKILMYSI